jgi:hypothetical protein
LHAHTNHPSDGDEDKDDKGGLTFQPQELSKLIHLPKANEIKTRPKSHDTTYRTNTPHPRLLDAQNFHDPKRAGRPLCTPRTARCRNCLMKDPREVVVGEAAVVAAGEAVGKGVISNGWEGLVFGAAKRWGEFMC